MFALVTVLLEVIPGYNMIRVFTFYGIILGLSGFALIVPSAFREKNAGSIMIFCALVPLLPAAYLQVERKTVIHISGVEFNHNAITHVFIIISELILFFAAVKRIKTNERASGSSRGNEERASGGLTPF